MREWAWPWSIPEIRGDPSGVKAGSDEVLDGERSGYGSGVGQGRGSAEGEAAIAAQDRWRGWWGGGPKFDGGGGNQGLERDRRIHGTAGEGVDDAVGILAVGGVVGVVGGVGVPGVVESREGDGEVEGEEEAEEQTGDRAAWAGRGQARGFDVQSVCMLLGTGWCGNRNRGVGVDGFGGLWGCGVWLCVASGGGV